MPENKTIRDTDIEAIAQAKTLVATARHAALAANGKDGGHPSISRVQISTDMDGAPVILASSLSPHTEAMINRPDVSLLVGEPGKGDPLAHPRITLFCKATKIERQSDDHARLRRRHLARHPKAELYVDFGDFAFFKLAIKGASLNGGFGKAYELTADDLTVAGDIAGMAQMEESAIAHMNTDHSDAVSLYATVLAKQKSTAWKVAAIDPEAMILTAGDAVARVGFPTPLQDAGHLRLALKDLADIARASGKTEG